MGKHGENEGEGVKSPIKEGAKISPPLSAWPRAKIEAASRKHSFKPDFYSISLNPFLCHSEAVRFPAGSIPGKILSPPPLPHVKF